MPKRPISSESSSRPPEQRIAAIVEEFVRRFEAGETLDLDAFCAAQPRELQAKVMEECQRFLQIKKVLKAQSQPPTRPGGSKPGESGPS